MLRSIRRRIARASSHSDVVPRQYIILNVDSNAHTRDECIKADKQNQMLYQEKLNAVSGLSDRVNSLIIDNVPEPNNVDRFDAWRLRNKKVPANEQCMAVQILYNNNKLLDRDYKPEDAIEMAKNFPPIFKSSMSSLPPPQEQNVQYKIIDDKDILKTSMEECRRIDLANQRAYEKGQHETTKLRRRLSSVCLFDVDDVQKPPNENNVEKKVRLTAETVGVSAFMQANAVQTLLQRRLIPYIHFQPQNAISMANRYHPPSAPPPHSIA